MKTAVFATLLTMTPLVMAQENVTGKYTGSFVAQAFGRDVDVGLTMVISSFEEGVVKGVATMGGHACPGDYPFEGSLKGGELAVRSNVKGGRAGDCTFGMRGTLQGNTIAGTMGRYPLRL